MMNDEIYSIEQIKNIIKENESLLKDKYFAERFFLFGSYANGSPTKKSDIDLLVDFSSAVDMFHFMDLQEYLKEIFGKKIDLGTKNGLKSFIKNKILNEAIAL
jgi:uncharacterized protein